MMSGFYSPVENIKITTGWAILQFNSGACYLLSKHACLCLLDFEFVKFTQYKANAKLPQVTI